LSSAPPPAFATGIHVPRDPTEPRGKAGAAWIAEDIDPGGSPIERALYRTEVRSYAVVPVIHRGKDVAWMTLAHHVRGAPSKEFLPLLMALGERLAPSLVRARARTRPSGTRRISV